MQQWLATALFVALRLSPDREGKSACSAERGDIAALLRSCVDKSLAFVDELRRKYVFQEWNMSCGCRAGNKAESGMTASLRLAFTTL